MRFSTLSLDIKALSKTLLLFVFLTKSVLFASVAQEMGLAGVTSQDESRLIADIVRQDNEREELTRRRLDLAKQENRLSELEQARLKMEADPNNELWVLDLMKAKEDKARRRLTSIEEGISENNIQRQANVRKPRKVEDWVVDLIRQDAERERVALDKREAVRRRTKQEEDPAKRLKRERFMQGLMKHMQGETDEEWERELMQSEADRHQRRLSHLANTIGTVETNTIDKVETTPMDSVQTNAIDLVETNQAFDRGSEQLEDVNPTVEVSIEQTNDAKDNALPKWVNDIIDRENEKMARRTARLNQQLKQGEL